MRLPISAGLSPMKARSTSKLGTWRDDLHAGRKKSASIPICVASEGAASLLPDADKPLLSLRCALRPTGILNLFISAFTGVVRSRAKLGYATVRPEDLPAGFTELSRRIEAAKLARGASRLVLPQQEVVEEAARPPLGVPSMQDAERSNATLSLAANRRDRVQSSRLGNYSEKAGPVSVKKVSNREIAASDNVAFDRSASCMGRNSRRKQSPSSTTSCCGGSTRDARAPVPLPRCDGTVR